MLAGVALPAAVLATGAGLARAWGHDGLAFARAFVGTGVLTGAAVLMVLLTLDGVRRQVMLRGRA